MHVNGDVGVAENNARIETCGWRMIRNSVLEVGVRPALELAVDVRGKSEPNRMRARLDG